MTQTELEIQTKAFLEQTSHMQILGDPKALTQGTEVNASELCQDLNLAVLEFDVMVDVATLTKFIHKMKS